MTNSKFNLMKKITLFSLLMLFGVAVTQAQGEGSLRGGVHAGIPVGDAGDLTTFAIAVELGYLFDLSDDFQAGPRIGYSHSFGDEVDTGIGTIEIDDIQFLPIGGAARFNVSDQFGLGADIGYALGINDGNDGGFYYSPRASYAVSNSVDLVLAYRGITRDGGSFDMITFGVEFGLFE